MGCELREYSWPDYWYVGREERLFDSSIKVSKTSSRLRLVHKHVDLLTRLSSASTAWRHCMQDDEIDQMHNMFARIGKEEYPVEDISAEDWLRSQVRCSCPRAADVTQL